MKSSSRLSNAGTLVLSLLLPTAGLAHSLHHQSKVIFYSHPGFARDISAESEAEALGEHDLVLAAAKAYDITALTKLVATNRNAVSDGIKRSGRCSAYD